MKQRRDNSDLAGAYSTNNSINVVRKTFNPLSYLLGGIKKLADTKHVFCMGLVTEAVDDNMPAEVPSDEKANSIIPRNAYSRYAYHTDNYLSV